MKCKRCNREVIEGMNYCGYCGLFLHESRQCDNCGEIVDAKYNFCYKCGHKINVNYENIITNIIDDKILINNQPVIKYQQINANNIKSVSKTNINEKDNNLVLKFIKNSDYKIRNIAIIIFSLVLIFALLAPITKIYIEDLYGTSNSNLFGYIETLFKGIGKFSLMDLYDIDFNSNFDYILYLIVDDYNNEMLFQRTALYIGIFIVLALFILPIVSIVLCVKNYKNKENSIIPSYLLIITFVLSTSLFLIAPLYDVSPGLGLIIYFIINGTYLVYDIIYSLYNRIIKLSKQRVIRNLIYAMLLIFLFFGSLGKIASFKIVDVNESISYNNIFQIITYLDGDDPQILPFYKTYNFLSEMTSFQLQSTNIWLAYLSLAIPLITIIIGILIINTIYKTIFNIYFNKDKNLSSGVLVIIIFLLIMRIGLGYFFSLYFNQYLEMFSREGLLYISNNDIFLTIFAIIIFVYKLNYQRKIRNI